MTLELVANTDNDLEFTLEAAETSINEINSESLRVLIRDNLKSGGWKGISKVTNGLTMSAHIRDANATLEQMTADHEVLVRQHPQCYAVKQYKLNDTKAVYGK